MPARVPWRGIVRKMLLCPGYSYTDVCSDYHCSCPLMGSMEGGEARFPETNGDDGPSLIGGYPVAHHQMALDGVVASDLRWRLLQGREARLDGINE